MFVAGAVLVGTLGFLAGRQAEQLAMAELVAEAHGRQGIQLAGWRNPQQMPDADQVEVGFGVLRGGIAEIGGQVVHAGGADVFPARISQQHAAAEALQGLADGAPNRIGADDQVAAGRGLGDLQQARQGAGGGALQDHRADDHQKGQRHQQRRLGMAFGAQADGEDRRDRRGDDPARGDPAEQGALAPAQRRTPGRQRHVQRPGDELDQQQHQQRRRAQAEQGIDVQARGQEDEQAGNQQDAEVFLEVQDLPYVDALHVGQAHAHQGDGEQSGFVHHPVRGDEYAQHRGQRRQVVQVVRQPVAAQDDAQRPAAEDAEQAAAEDHSTEGLQAV